jgi:hypothetical protein
MFKLGDRVYYNHPNGNKYLGKICMFHSTGKSYVIFPLETIPNSHGSTIVLDSGNCNYYLSGASGYITDPAIRTTAHYDRFIDESKLELASSLLIEKQIEPSQSIPEPEEDHGGFKYI